MSTRGEATPDPPEDREARTFPNRTFAVGTTVWRVHRNGEGPWHFADNGRFGLPAPRGTCYVALEPMTAVAEKVLREFIAIIALHVSELEPLVIRTLTLPRAFAVADTTDRKALLFGITREFAAEPDPHVQCRKWALWWCVAGELGGVHYWARLDLAPSGLSLALFDNNGERKWRKGRPRQLASKTWRKKIESEFGLRVLTDPSDSELTVVDHW